MKQEFDNPEQEKVLEDAKKLMVNQLELTQKIQHLIRVPLKKPKKKIVS